MRKKAAKALGCSLGTITNRFEKWNELEPHEKDPLMPFLAELVEYPLTTESTDGVAADVTPPSQDHAELVRDRFWQDVANRPKVGEYQRRILAARKRIKEICAAAAVTGDFGGLASFDELNQNHQSIFPHDACYDPRHDGFADHVDRTPCYDTAMLQTANEAAKRLADRSIRVLAPEFSVYPRCIFERIRGYFGVRNLQIDTTGVSKTAVDRVNEGQEFDFIVAATVTMLVRGRAPARQYSFGMPLFVLPQYALVTGKWDRQQPISFVYLEHATGHVQFLMTRAKFQKTGAPELFQPHPVETLDEFLKVLTSNPTGETRAFSIWEPARTNFRDKFPPQDALDSDKFEMALLVNRKRWRADNESLGDDERALYCLVAYVAEEFGLRNKPFELNKVVSSLPPGS
jgi:hypothetical protein